MLDIGWGELLVIGVVALIVVGPKDLPKFFRSAGQFMGRARGMAREFQRSMEQAADESGYKEVSRSLRAADGLRLNAATSSARKYAEGLVKGVDPAGAPTIGKAPPPKAPTAAAPEPTARVTPAVVREPAAEAAPERGPEPAAPAADPAP